VVRYSFHTQSTAILKDDELHRAVLEDGLEACVTTAIHQCIDSAYERVLADPTNKRDRRHHKHRGEGSRDEELDQREAMMGDRPRF